MSRPINIDNSKRESKEASFSPEDLSYSHFLDRIRSDPASHQISELDRIRPRLATNWIPDHAVVGCQICKKEFGLTFRRHHCRACGKIVCAYCSPKEIVLPKGLDTFPQGPKQKSWFWSFFTERKNLSQPERVCTSCYNRYSQAQQIEIWIKVFAYFDLDQLTLYSSVSEEFSRAANVRKSLFRDIQYILPGYALSESQRLAIRLNRHLLYGHSRYLVKYITSINWSDPLDIQYLKEVLQPYFHGEADPLDPDLDLHQPDTRRRCWDLMCTRFCSFEISGFEVLELLDIYIPDLEIRKYLISRIQTLDDQELQCILLQLTMALRFEISEDTSLLDLLVTRSLKSCEIRTGIYWNLIYLRAWERKTFEPFYNLFLMKLDQNLGRDIVLNQLIEGRRTVKQLGRDIDDLQILKGVIPLPVCPDLIIVDLDPKKIQIFDSSTHPMMIPLICQKRSTELREDLSGKSTLEKEEPFELPFEKAFEDPHQEDDPQEEKSKEGDFLENPLEEKKILYKRESLIKDYVVMNVIRLMDQILKRDLKIDFGIKTYRVLPTSLSDGLIEIISDAETLYTIEYRKHFTIQNYILENNQDLPITEVRDRFIRSAAAYCVISYLLGIGDRHMDNIMISSDGYLFHIDYGYILGFDPKPLSPSMRITKDIVDAMGGELSTDFKRFKEYCGQIYNCLRLYTPLFTSMLLILTENGLNLDKGKYSMTRLKAEIFTRFMPSEHPDEAEDHLLIKIDSSYRSNRSQAAFDYWHYHVRETFQYPSTFKRFLNSS